MRIVFALAAGLLAGASATAQFVFGHSHPHGFVASTGPIAEILFAASDGPTAPCEGMEPWSLRGPLVTRVAAIVPGTTGSYPRDLVAAPGGGFYFTADDRVLGRELWATTGAAGVTALVRDIRSGAGSMPNSLTVVGSVVCMSANDGVAGRELWYSDGTSPGTRRVDVNPGPADSDPHQLVAWGGKLYFVADNGLGAGLFSFDPSGPTLTPLGPRGANPSNLTPAGSLLFCAATDGTNGRELWSTDGTSVNTKLLKDLRVGVGSSAPDQIRAGLGGIVFTALDNPNGRELWFSNGTAGGTIRLSQIGAGAVGGHIQELVATPTHAWFQADNGAGKGLWVTTGGAPTNIPLPGGGSAPRDLTPFASGIVFSAESSSNGRELWTSNGVTATMIEIRPGIDGSLPAFFFVDGARVLFSAHGATGIEPWSTDGTSATAVHDINPKAPTQPELHAESASMGPGAGATLTFRYASGAPSGLAYTLVSAAPIVPLALPVGLGVTGFLRVDLTVSLTLGPVVLDAAGRGSLSVPIPQPLITRGLTVGTQGVVLDPIPGSIAFTDSLSAGSYEVDAGGGQTIGAKIGTYKDDTWEHKIPVEVTQPGATGQCYLGLVHRQWDEASQTWTEVLLETWPYQPLADDGFSIDGFVELVPKLGTQGDKLELRYWTEEPANAAGGAVLYVSYC